MASDPTPRPFLVVLTGNPNCGKTTLFNALTGLRARVGNYAGVTVERKEGALQGNRSGRPITVLDLPGTYSLSPQSLDEQIARDILFQRLPEVPEPDLVVVVIDASNLQRNLYYATQVIELGHPTVLALNMVDVARENGQDIDVKALSAALGVPVHALVASDGEGVPELSQALQSQAGRGQSRVIPRSFAELPEAFGHEAEALETRLRSVFPKRARLAAAEALLILSDDRVLDGHPGGYPDGIASSVAEARGRLEALGIDWRSAAIEARYARAAAIQMAVTVDTALPGESFSDRVDRVLTHRVWGLLIFLGIMLLMFVSIFFLAEIPKGWLEAGLEWVAAGVSGSLPPGDLNDLLSRGVITGVGAVVVFLPQICLLFLFISLLEDTGYMSRAAFLMDRLMSRVGLHGKSFIPMLSSFACAIPGIMATRTIETPKDRLATILVAPLMSCSARLPVYTLLISACIGGGAVWQGLTLTFMYVLGIVGALGMAWLFKRTLLRGEPPPLILELPPYKRPVPAVVLRHMWDRAKLFLRRAGTVILGINVLLWFLATYPRDAAARAQEETQRTALVQEAFPGTQAAAVAGQLDVLRSLDPADAQATPVVRQAAARLAELDRQAAGDELRHSFAGRAGLLIEPVLRPLGFDWKIGVGIIASFAAREVFVSTMSVVYNAGSAEAGGAAGEVDLVSILKRETRPDGSPVYTRLTGFSLMVFYVFALQCVSTVAVVKRETNSWKWPLFQWAYMTGLAWVLSFLTYQVGRLLGG
jgi:ferrous iron transport protein B